LIFRKTTGFTFLEKDVKTGLNTEKPASRKAKPTNPPIYSFFTAGA